MQDIEDVCVSVWPQETARFDGEPMQSYDKILEKIDEFAPLISDLSELLQSIEDLEERKQYRRALGEAMGALEGKIAYPIRLRLGVASKD